MKEKVLGFRIVIGVVMLMGLSVFLGFLAGKSANKSTEQTANPDEMLVVIEDHAFLDYYIVYDKDTKIIYYQGVGHGACLDPLYNPDGTYKLYKGND